MRAWISAFRLRTLPLALSCIAMGGFLAVANNAFRWDIFSLCVLTTIFLQVLSNLANDYGDFIHGADHNERTGPSRAVQSGAISMDAMRRALYLFVTLCLISGISLLLLSFGFNTGALLFFLGLGLLCIVAAIAYTVGRKPYGYAGLGDISVLIFFGLVGVVGSQYLFTHTFSWPLVLPALSCGLFSTAVLNVNNIRDIDSDKKAGKLSLPVRMGRNNAIIYHWFLLVSGIICAAWYTWLNYNGPLQFLFVIVIPFLIVNGISVARKPNEELDPFLKQMALTTLLFVILFGVGNILA
jgi:1,4-dihydroxy-2-naphthoate octaprenyltransferase